MIPARDKGAKFCDNRRRLSMVNHVAHAVQQDQLCIPEAQFEHASMPAVRDNLISVALDYGYGMTRQRHVVRSGRQGRGRERILSLSHKVIRVEKLFERMRGSPRFRRGLRSKHLVLGQSQNASVYRRDGHG